MLKALLSLTGFCFLSLSVACSAPAEPEVDVDTHAQELRPRLRPSGCIVTGCSGEVCARSEVTSTCQWRPEYACYATATCAAQADGQCGWTPTTELSACLASGGGSAY